MSHNITLGIICGSGGEDLGLDIEDTLMLDTKYGTPSSPLQIFNAEGIRGAVLSRHGTERTIPPHRINHHANIAALKELGVEHIISATSVGSLQRSLMPPMILIPRDWVNFWNIPTFIEDEIQHITPSVSEPLRRSVIHGAELAGINVRDEGIYVQTSGPRLETRAEVRILAGFGDVVGMSMASEATLSQEAGIAFANISSIDNFANGVSGEVLAFEDILEMARQNFKKVKKIINATLGVLE